MARPAQVAVSASTVTEPLRVALLGNPNTGKTTLFNRLCGLRAKTANFPGTTTESRVGRAALEPGRPPASIIDLPGLYRLGLDLPESRVCRRELTGEWVRRPDVLVLVLDATNLPRNLFLAAELLAFGLPTVIALSMVDLSARRGLAIDTDRLGARLGCRVVTVMPRRGTGVDALRDAVLAAHGAATGSISAGASTGAPEGLPDADDTAAVESWADEVAAQVSGRGSGDAETDGGDDELTDRVDRVFTHPVLGSAIFALVMFGLFWSIFSFASVPMDMIDAIFGHLGGWLESSLPAGAIRDLLVEGVVGGIAGTVVFLPQICLLFFLISLLEDTGYLARAAFVTDRLLSRFGLPGHAFVPLLSSHACALPGILASRLIPNRKDRLATILVAPFMSCSARLPVYVLLTGLLFVGEPLWAAIAFAGCYVLGAAAALGSALLFRRTILDGATQPMIMELPTYKVPSVRTAAIAALDQGRRFLRKAGTIILAICIVMWWLSAYPQSAPPAEARSLEARAALPGTDPEQAAAWSAEAARLTDRHAQANSFAGRIGRAVQPVFAPLDYDWQVTVGILTSFIAREVFVSTLAVLLVGDEDPDLEDRGVLDTISRAERDDGSPVFKPASAASLLVFFVLAMQCLPTLVLTRKETGDGRWALFQLVYMTGLAYACAWLTYRGLLAMGVA